jgi:uncharacterized protein YecE (DUF72 family)
LHGIYDISPMKQYGKFRAGTSGLVLTEANKGAFPADYQDKSRLSYYASKFNSIEINSSFYNIPRGLTYKKWSAMVPDDFQFTVKLWRGITHVRDLNYQAADLASFFEGVNCLGDKKGCILIQFPAKAVVHFDRFRKLLEAVRNLDPEESWRIAVEFRDPLWYHPDMYAILNECRASLVLHDMPNSIPLKINEKAAFIYLRFHGEKGDYRGSYENDFLISKAEEIRLWLSEGKDVYVYFNNTIGAAATNLLTLNELLI